MNKTQKIIKYVAIILGVYLVVSIFTSLFSITTNIIDFNNLFNTKADENAEYKSYDLNIDLENLNIDIPYSNLKIVNSNEYKLETNNSDLKITDNNNTLFIKDNQKRFKKRNYDVTIYLPVEKNYNNINIETGAGRVEISKLYTYNIRVRAVRTYIYLSHCGQPRCPCRLQG